MEEIINHHVGNVKSLKEIHDKNGGIDAIEAMGRTMGANTSPLEYSGLKLHPQVHADLMNLMRPGAHQYLSPTPEYESHQRAERAAHADASKENPNADWTETSRIARERVPDFVGNWGQRQLPDSTYDDDWDDTKHREAIDSTYSEAMFGGNGDGGDPVALKNHENAAINRALDRFKRHHKL